MADLLGIVALRLTEIGRQDDRPIRTAQSRPMSSRSCQSRKLRWASSRSRISGFSIVSSIQTNSDRLTAATTASRTMKGDENQSSLLPSSSTACSADRPIAMVAMPSQSPSFSKLELHRLPLQREIERGDHHRCRHHVDEEDGLPAVVFGEIAADGRADRRREGDGRARTSQARSAAGPSAAW